MFDYLKVYRYHIKLMSNLSLYYKSILKKESNTRCMKIRHECENRIHRNKKKMNSTIQIRGFNSMISA